VLGGLQVGKKKRAGRVWDLIKRGISMSYILTTAGKA
jgi:hypothetical protein